MISCHIVLCPSLSSACLDHTSSAIRLQLDFSFPPAYNSCRPLSLYGLFLWVTIILFECQLNKQNVGWKWIIRIERHFHCSTSQVDPLISCDAAMQLQFPLLHCPSSFGWTYLCNLYIHTALICIHMCTNKYNDHLLLLFRTWSFPQFIFSLSLAGLD